jgi:hypothetical protein
MNDLSNLNPDNFKKWMRSQNDFDANMEQNLEGASVETRFSAKRIIAHMIPEEGRVSKMAKEFVESGGALRKVDGDEYLIEVASGSFYIHKKYVIV